MHLASCQGPSLPQSLAFRPTCYCRNSFFPWAIVVLQALLFALTISFPYSISAQESTGLATLADHTPPQIQDGTALFAGHYEQSSMLRLAIALTPPHLTEEEQFLRDLQDPASPSFHQFLSEEEWNARFAPSAQDEQRVVDWAQAQGLKVVERYANRLLVDVEAPAGTLEKAFGVRINRYHVGEDMEFSNDRDPVMPASLSPTVAAVLGLNNIQRMRSSMPMASQLNLPDYAPGPVAKAGAESHGNSRSAEELGAETRSQPNVSNGGFIDPVDVYSSQMYNYGALYGLDHCCNVPQHNSSAGSPPESSIALATWGTVNFTDTTAFFQHYGLAWNLTGFVIDGPFPSCPAGQYCYSDETTLDSEWSTATSNSFGAWQNTAHVYIYMDAVFSQNGNADMYNQMLHDGHARVFSTSWSCTENYGCSSTAILAWHSIFNQMVGQGWTLMAASGDRGASDDCSWNSNTGAYNSAPHSAVAYPASDPDVIGVGGTSINGFAGPGNAFVWSSEPAWQGGTSKGSCGFNDGGSGGGKSAIFTRPSYQTAQGSTVRLVPDISLNSGGIGQNYYFHGNMSGVGGTSIAAPEFAGFFAQENAYLDAVGKICGPGHNATCSPIGDAHGALYYQGDHNYADHNPYYDITTGCNSNDATALYSLKYFCAGPGYDEVTGWGTANMLQLAWALNWGVLNNYSNGVPYVTFSGPAVNKWYSANQTVSWTVHDYAGNVANSHGTGIAGSTQGWDSIPSDPTSEAHPGTGNLFYAGPEYANATTGCLSFVAGSCAGGVSQGCHTAHVHGWNNEGWTTAGQGSFPETYGPICFDDIAPVTKPTLAGTLNASDGWYSTPVKVTLSASDAGSTVSPATGSGVGETFYAVDTATCTPSATATCAKYTGALTVSSGGTHTFYYFSKDNAGNYEARKSIAFSIDNTIPATNAVFSPAADASGWNHNAVSVTLTATDSAGPGVATTFYAVNSATCTPAATATCTKYTAPFSVSTVGTTKVTFFSKDKSGISSSVKSVNINIDETAPVTGATLSGTKSGTGYIGPVTVTLSATDNLSGVASTKYVVITSTSSPTETYTGPFKVTFSGTVKIQFTSEDKAGNIEATKTITFTD